MLRHRPRSTGRSPSTGVRATGCLGKGWGQRQPELELSQPQLPLSWALCQHYVFKSDIST